MIRILTAVLVVSACATAVHAQAKAAAEKEARVLKGDDKATAASNPQCKLFSSAEAGRYIGGKVQTVENAAMGSGCQWAVGSGDGSMLVQVVPARYHEPPSLGKGFRK